jgi:hypothetical protein
MKNPTVPAMIRWRLKSNPTAAPMAAQIKTDEPNAKPPTASPLMASGGNRSIGFISASFSRVEVIYCQLVLTAIEVALWMQHSR